MTRQIAFSLAALIALFTFLPGSYAERGPSTPEERDTALKAIEMLERDPLGKDAKTAKRWLTMWLIEIPDVSVKMCGTMLGPVLESKKNYSAELVQQMMYSSAAFIIRNPDKTNDDVAVYQAGVEGSLRAYEAILKSKPKARWPFLDDLLQKRDAGELRAFVESASEQCK